MWEGEVKGGACLGQTRLKAPARATARTGRKPSACGAPAASPAGEHGQGPWRRGGPVRRVLQEARLKELRREVLVLFSLFCSARASPLCCFWWQDNAPESISLFR